VTQLKRSGGAGKSEGWREDGTAGSPVRMERIVGAERPAAVASCRLKGHVDSVGMRSAFFQASDKS
jgi:hypothetical protein